MLWLALVLFIALVIAVLRGGRLVNLGDIELRGWWLLFIALGLQAGTNWLPEDSTTLGVSMMLFSYVLLLVMVWLNRSKPGMWIAGLGVLANLTVIALNGGMPVLAGAAEVASGFTISEPDLSSSFKHIILDEPGAIDVTVPILPKGGSPTAIAGVTMRAPAGADRAATVAKARAVAEQVATQVRAAGKPLW